MVFHLIGLGLDVNSLSLEEKEAIKECEKIYLESYTIDFPYMISELEKTIGKKIIPLKREEVEGESFLDRATYENIALLVYGDPFSATTHSQLILSCKRKKIPYKVYHNASIVNSIGEIGLSVYKFGKICSIPKWREGFKPTSFVAYLKENRMIKAHSLILVDIGMSLKEAIEELEEASKKENFSLPKKIIVISCLGTKKQNILFDMPKNLLKEDVEKPFCLVVPSEELHFLEEEFLKKTN
ncbi:MAG: diphthine synthase [Candidatus Pacearchaeota archaeon]